MFSSLHTHESVSRGSRVRRKRKNANHLNHKFETYFSWGNFAFVHCFSLILLLRALEQKSVQKWQPTLKICPPMLRLNWSNTVTWPVSNIFEACFCLFTRQILLFFEPVIDIYLTLKNKLSSVRESSFNMTGRGEWRFWNSKLEILAAPPR